MNEKKEGDIMKPRKIIIDCDPGHDDAMAILLAALHPQLSIEAITTVAGNVEIEKTTLNALKLCELGGAENVPVARGASGPLMRPLVTASEVHGMTGLDGTSLPEPNKSLDPRHGVDLLIEKILVEDKITLAAIGPLTNVALALIKCPEIKEHLDELVLMGGGTYGNITPVAEFNIYVDAEAAKVVFDSGIPVTVVGLDVTRKVLATPDIVEDIRNLHHPISDFIFDLFQYFHQIHEHDETTPSPPIHDVCAIAYCIDPSLFHTVPCRIDVETKGEFTYGMTVIDRRASESNARFAVGVDSEGIWDLLKGTIQATISSK